MFHYDAQHNGRAPYSGPETGLVKWELESGDGTYYSPLLSSENNAYFTTDQGLFSYNISLNPVLNWHYQVDAVYGSPILGSENVIYFVGRLNLEGNYLFAINSSGTLKWRRKIDNIYYFTSPVIGDDGKIYYIGEFSINEEIKPGLAAIEPSDGLISWFYQIEGTGTQSQNPVSFPTIDNQGNIYFGYNKTLLVVDFQGNEKWRRDFNQAGARGISTPSISQGVVYVQVARAYALDAATGDIFGISENSKIYPEYWSSPAIASNGDVYMTGIKGKAPNGPYNILYVFDPLQQPLGEEWEPKTEKLLDIAAKCSSPVIDNQDIAYFVAGKKLKRYVNGEIEILFSAPLILGRSLSFDNNGILYLPGISKLYAIGP